MKTRVLLLGVLGILLVSVPAFALAAWMAARRVQTGLDPAVAHTVLEEVELARSAVLFTL